MNSKPFALNYFLPVALVTCFSIVLLSWGGQKQTQHGKQNFTDTVPKTKADKPVRDLDDVLDELDKAELKMNLEKMNADLQQAMKQVDAAKIQMNIDKAMKEVDMQKIKAQLDQSLKEIDAVKMEKDIKESVASVDWEKMNKQLTEQMEEVKKIDMSKLDADMKKLELQMKDLKPQLEKEMAKAKESVEKAKIEMKEYKGFVDGLERDGLINKNEKYTIQHKNGELIINDKRQPAGVYNKYRSFLEKHKKFTIKKSDDDFNIDNDDHE